MQYGLHIDSNLLLCHSCLGREHPWRIQTRDYQANWSTKYLQFERSVVCHHEDHGLNSLPLCRLQVGIWGKTSWKGWRLSCTLCSSTCITVARGRCYSSRRSWHSSLCNDRIAWRAHGFMRVPWPSPSCSPLDAVVSWVELEHVVAIGTLNTQLLRVLVVVILGLVILPTTHRAWCTSLLIISGLHWPNLGFVFFYQNAKSQNLTSKLTYKFMCKESIRIIWRERERASLTFISNLAITWVLQVILLRFWLVWNNGRLKLCTI